ncbi:adenylate cyclase [Babesia caballi]|uniref:Adenylate cyclase n=1 Tax=Babesia caballi TaxID=5871 RepID=A0AAV4LTU8_BABCB|nr:adenylate cyclase [Babesia caballi]
MKAPLPTTPSPSQCSYDYENASGSDCVRRKASSKEGSLSHRSTIDSCGNVGETYEDLYLLQEIAFDVPEIEGNLLNAVSNTKQRNSFAFPAWFLEVFMAILHFLVVGALVFTFGLVAGFFISSPTGSSGSFMWSTRDTPAPNQHKLFVIRAPDGSLTIEGALYLSHHALNPTPFTASLSSLVSVFYLPQPANSPDLQTTCLREDSWAAAPTGVSALLKFPQSPIFQQPKSAPTTSAFPRTPVVSAVGGASAQCGASDAAIEEGNLVTLHNVKRVRGQHAKSSMTVSDSSVFNIFTSYLVIGNRLHVVANVEGGLNEVSYLITVNQSINRGGDTAALAERLLQDCTNGELLLRLESVEQRFETMFFGGDMLPQQFFPVSVPCQVATATRSNADLAPVWREQVGSFVNQFNILLNMGTMSDRQCPLRSPERPASSA